MLCQKTTRLLLSLLTTSLGLISTYQPAQASNLLGEWYYTIDSFNDGLSPGVNIGISPY